MAERAPERTQSPAYRTLRASSRRLLTFIESEVARRRRSCRDLQRSVRDDRLAPGLLPSLNELHALGLVEITRYPKRHICQLSDGWRDITTPKQAMIISGVARYQRKPPLPTPSQPATASTA